MINLKDCIEIGQFTRSHGYKGQVILKLNNFSFDDIEEMEWVFVLIDGLPVPFFIDEFSERSPDSLFVILDSIMSIEKTKQVIGSPVFLEKKIFKGETEKEQGFSDLIGYKIIDSSSGIIGYLDSVIDNVNNPLLRILDNKKEVLLPLQDEFIVDVSHSSKEIKVNCPPGLLEIF